MYFLKGVKSILRAVARDRPLLSRARSSVQNIGNENTSCSDLIESMPLEWAVLRVILHDTQLF